MSQYKRLNLKRTLLLPAELLIVALMIAACDNFAQPSTSSDAIQSSNSAATGTSLPTPIETVLSIIPTPAPPQTLGNATPEEVGSIALAATYNSRVLSGTPIVMLTRRVTLEELGNLGLGWTSFSSIEEPPLVLVILKGDFSAVSFPGGFKRNEPCSLVAGGVQCPQPEHYQYIGYVYDLWVGGPSIFMQSKNGGIFKQVLNDPTLPYEAPLSTPDQRHTSTNGNKVLHYGDYAIGEPAEGQKIHEANIGAVHYIAYTDIAKHDNADGVTADPSKVYATVSWDWNSAKGGQDYIATNKRLLPQVAAQGGQAEAWLVFKDYMPVEQFRSFAQQHGLKVGLSYIRAIDEKPVPVYAPYYTIKVNANQGADAVPAADLSSKLASITADPRKQISLKGVYVTHVWVDAKQLITLAADPSLYYVDVTPELIRSDLAKAGIAGSEQAQVVSYPYLIFNALVEQPYQSKLAHIHL